LRDNKTARDFVSQLPLTLTLEDYASTEKISDLPKRLSTEAHLRAVIRLSEILLFMLRGKPGDILSNAKYANGLIIFGKIDGTRQPSIAGSLKVTN